MLKKIKRLSKILYYFFTDSDNLLLHLMEMKAYESLEKCYDLSVRSTEELEDLIFHIRAYLNTPYALIEFKYPELKNLNVKKMLKRFEQKKMTKKEFKKYFEFVTDTEQQRAIERDFIFESAKILNFGFDFVL